MEPTKEKVLAEYKDLKARKLDDKTIEATICRRLKLRFYNTMKHACVAARIGDDAKRGAANMSILASRATKSAPILAATPSECC